MNDQFSLLTITPVIFNHIFSYSTSKDLHFILQTNKILNKRIHKFIKEECNTIIPRIQKCVEPKDYLKLYEFITYSPYYLTRYKERLNNMIKRKGKGEEMNVATVSTNYTFREGIRCQVCSQTIPKGDLRFQAYFDNGRSYSSRNYYNFGSAHFACFTFPVSITEIEEIQQLSKLKSKDQRKIERKLINHLMNKCLDQELEIKKREEERKQKELEREQEKLKRQEEKKREKEEEKLKRQEEKKRKKEEQKKEKEKNKRQKKDTSN